AVLSAGSVLSTVLCVAVLLAARHAAPAALLAAILLAAGTALLAAALLTAGTAHACLTSRALAGLRAIRSHHGRCSDRSAGEAADDQRRPDEDGPDERPATLLLACRRCRRRRRVGIGGPGARGTPSRRIPRQRIRQQVGRRRSVVGPGASLRRAAAGLVGLTTLAGACWLAGSGLADACWLAGRTGVG